ncbi:unnamed protein product, partial [Darwinula stevensoni]
CELCGYSSAVKANTRRHVRGHVGDRPHRCEACGMGFSRKDILARHMTVAADAEFTWSGKTQGSPLLHFCRLCDYRSTRRTDLARHVRTHTGVRPYDCGECGRRFTQKANLTRHLTVAADMEFGWSGKTWGNIRLHFCRLCDYRSPKKADVARHVRTHTGARPYTCEDCRKSFCQKAHLTRHRISHLNLLQIHFCELCGYSSAVKANTRRHVRGHVGDRPHRCEACGMGFSRKDILSRHMTVAADAEFTWSGKTQGSPLLHFCRLCDYRSTRRTDLARHVRTHTGVRPYDCGECGRRFTQKANLTRHLTVAADMEFGWSGKTWGNIRLHFCRLCDYRSPKKADVARHVRTHTGARPYTCEDCRKSFCQKAHLTRHRISHLNLL